MRDATEIQGLAVDVLMLRAALAPTDLCAMAGKAIDEPADVSVLDTMMRCDGEPCCFAQLRSQLIVNDQVKIQGALHATRMLNLALLSWLLPD